MSRVEVNRIKVGLYEKLLEKGALSIVEVNRKKSRDSMRNYWREVP